MGKRINKCYQFIVASVTQIVICLLFIIVIAFKADGKDMEFFYQGPFCGLKMNETIIIPARYIQIESYKKDEFFIATDNCYYKTLYTKNGNIVIPPGKYVTIEPVTSNNLKHFLVVGSGYGLVDSIGKQLLEPIYTSIKPIGDSSHGYFYIVRYNGFEGLIDETGNFLIKPEKYHSINLNKKNEEDVLNCIEYGKGIDIFDLKLNLLDYEIFSDSEDKLVYISDLQYYDSEFKLVCYKKYRNGAGKIVIKDNTGKIIMDSYDDAFITSNSTSIYFLIREKEYTGILDLSLKSIVSLDEHFIAVAPMSQYIIGETKEHKQAIVKYNGQIVEKANHSKAHLDKYISEGKTLELIAYRDDSDNIPGFWGLKDLSNQNILEPQWDDFGALRGRKNSYITIFKDGLVGLADCKGNILFNPQYTGFKLPLVIQEYIILQNGNYRGIGDINGNVIIPADKFTEVEIDICNGFKCKIDNDLYEFSYKGELKSKKDLGPILKAENDERMGDQMFSEKKYDQAIKYYTSALKGKTSATLYFNRAAAYYNCNKYQQSIEDCKNCLNSIPNRSLEQKALNLIEKARYYQEENRTRIGDIISTIVGFTFVGVSSYLTSKDKQNSPNHNINSSSYRSEEEDIDSSQSEESSKIKSSKKSTCGFCGGKGSVIDYVANFGINTNPYCEECGKNVVSGHYHKKCIHCNGSGSK